MADTNVWADKTHIDKCVYFSSYDISLMNSNNLDRRVELFRMILKSGPATIEIGNPSVSDKDYNLIKKLIPDIYDRNNACIQVVVLPGNHNIRKTFEVIKQIKKSTVMFDIRECNAMELVNAGAKLMLKLASISHNDIRIGVRCKQSDIEQVLMILEVWKTGGAGCVIVSICPDKELCIPNYYAEIVGLFNRKIHIHNMLDKQVYISVRPSAGRSCGVWSSASAVLAGADIIEGCFVDSICSESVNLYELDRTLITIPGYESVINIDNTVRVYEFNDSTADVITILNNSYGISIPPAMKVCVENYIKEDIPESGAGYNPIDVFNSFKRNFSEYTPVFRILRSSFKSASVGIASDITVESADSRMSVTAEGNGRLDAVCNAVKRYFNISFQLSYYSEHIMSGGSSSKAVSYAGISFNGKMYWGAGISEDILRSAMDAVVCAVNRVENLGQDNDVHDERLNEILNYIQKNYQSVTLDELSNKFYLSKEYISKYIKNKSGITFSETVKKARIKKAKTLLKNSNLTVESVAETVGYNNVENFIRHFKKKYGMTPTQYRSEYKD